MAPAASRGASAPAAARATASRLTPRHKKLLLLLLLSLIFLLQLASWIANSMDATASSNVGPFLSLYEELPEPPEPPEEAAAAAHPVTQHIGPGTNLGTNWRGALAFLRRSKKRYVIIDAKNGLGNRLRALASAMSVAESLDRPVLLIWMPDLHLNCSIASMFAQPLPFALLEVEIPRPFLSSGSFQFYNYMRPEPGAVKDEPVDVDPDRHLFFRSAFVMNHPLGSWLSGGPQQQIRRLKPSAQVERLLVADRAMVGLHVRNVFDAPRDSESNVTTEGKSAMEGAQKEYGEEGTQKLLQWRRASHCTRRPASICHHPDSACALPPDACATPPARATPPALTPRLQRSRRRCPRPSQGRTSSRRCLQCSESTGSNTDATRRRRRSASTLPPTRRTRTRA